MMWKQCAHIQTSPLPGHFTPNSAAQKLMRGLQCGFHNYMDTIMSLCCVHDYRYIIQNIYDICILGLS